MGIQKEILYLGSVSKNENPNKIADSGLKFFTLPDCDFPLPEGCSAWAVIKLIREPHNENPLPGGIRQATDPAAETRQLSHHPSGFRLPEDSRGMAVTP